MSLRLKNTYSKRVEEFVPRDSGPVTIYTCGPTVYSDSHIGNFRSFLMADVLRRVLEQRGYKVRHVMNITDVGHLTEDHLADSTGEDKLARAARALGRDPYELARHYEQSFARDARALRIRSYLDSEADDPDLHPRATEHIPEMLALIQRLLERGYAYADGQGQIYFAVERFPQYGRLSGKVLEQLLPGARVAPREHKRDPRDFALWKVDPKHLMRWDPHSPRGWSEAAYARLRELLPEGVSPQLATGFPGWHIECSAMARARLGAQIDIHTGGEDTIFPHHECEIAQSYGARDDDSAPLSFSRYWLHARHLLVNGAKMSKRDGSLITIKALLEGQPHALGAELERAGFPGGRIAPATLRLALISLPFTQPMSFSADVLVQAHVLAERTQALYSRLQHVRAGRARSRELESLFTDATLQLDQALDDNLDMQRALQALQRVVAAAARDDLSQPDAELVLRFLSEADAVLDILPEADESGLLLHSELEQRAHHVEEPPAGPLDAERIAQLLAARFAARSGRDYARADAIRQGLAQHGVSIEDTAQGVRWRRV